MDSCDDDTTTTFDITAHRKTGTNPPKTPFSEFAVTNIEHWCSSLEDDLLDCWHTVQDMTRSRGLPLLERATFPDFVDFCWKFSSRHI